MLMTLAGEEVEAVVVAVEEVVGCLTFRFRLVRVSLANSWKAIPVADIHQFYWLARVLNYVKKLK